MRRSARRRASTVVVPGSSSSGGGAGRRRGARGRSTFTSLPKAGQTIRQGQLLYEIYGAPVVLLYGQRPRLPRSVGGHDRRGCAGAEQGPGGARRRHHAALGPPSGWDYFSTETAYALGLLQFHLGLTETGTLRLGQAVFLPGARVTGLGTTATRRAARPGRGLTAGL